MKSYITYVILSACKPLGTSDIIVSSFQLIKNPQTYHNQMDLLGFSRYFQVYNCIINNLLCHSLQFPMLSSGAFKLKMFLPCKTQNCNVVLRKEEMYSKRMSVFHGSHMYFGHQQNVASIMCLSLQNSNIHSKSTEDSDIPPQRRHSCVFGISFSEPILSNVTTLM